MRTDLEIYHDLLDAPDTGAAVMELTNQEFRAVNGLVSRDYDENGISGMIFGYLLLDGHRRFLESLEEGGTTL
jgi:hypothetical protein